MLYNIYFKNIIIIINYSIIYSMDNTEPCLGLFKVKKDIIYHFSKSCIYLWNVNKFYNIFIETR